MDPGHQRVIVVNGVRYRVAIRHDTGWSYSEDWWSGGDDAPPAHGDSGRSTPRAERDATAEIRKAHLKKEPWLRAEIAEAEYLEDDAEPGTGG